MTAGKEAGTAQGTLFEEEFREAEGLMSTVVDLVNAHRHRLVILEEQRRLDASFVITRFVRAFAWRAGRRRRARRYAAIAIQHLAHLCEPQR